MSKHRLPQGETAQESRIPRLSLEERETVIVKTAADDKWTVYSCVPSIARKIARIAKSCGANVRHIGFGGIEAELPEECVLLRGKHRKRVMTDEQRAAGAARLAAIREGR